ncbi:MAG: thioredoxin fold domain-containing protein, partial [Chitinophagaceae bacterium]
TGHSCANCRKMEEKVWKKEAVLQRLKDDFVIVSLYVDEKTALPESEQYTNDKGERITTLGEKNIDFEKKKFGINSQPLYMFMDAKGNILDKELYGYDADVDKFISHLEKVKKAFKELNQ